jgi:uncharacterized membrane protein
MSTLVAFAYPDEVMARAALAELGELQKQQLITIDDAVIAHHQGDKIKLDQAISTTGAGALGGALWGGLFGLIFLVPIAGMAIDAASGAIAGKMTDVGIDDSFAKELETKLGPGKVALVLLVRNATTDRVVADLKQHGLTGEVIHTNLSTEAEAKLRELVAS